MRLMKKLMSLFTKLETQDQTSCLPLQLKTGSQTSSKVKKRSEHLIDIANACTGLGWQMVLIVGNDDQISSIYMGDRKEIEAFANMAKAETGLQFVGDDFNTDDDNDSDGNFGSGTTH